MIRVTPTNSFFECFFSIIAVIIKPKIIQKDIESVSKKKTKLTYIYQIYGNMFYLLYLGAVHIYGFFSNLPLFIRPI